MRRSCVAGAAGPVRGTTTALARPPMDVVVGAGVIGLAVAYYAARDGARVAVVERGTIGGPPDGPASVASAGIVASGIAGGLHSSIEALNALSIQEYPALMAELEERSGVSPEFARTGVLRLAFSEVEAAALHARVAPLRAAGRRADWLSGEVLRREHPGLSTGALGGLYCEEDGSVSPPRLVRALGLASARLSVRLVEASPVAGFVTESGERVRGVLLANGERLGADQVVLAAGAWSGRLGALLGLDVPVLPVRGQIFAVQQPAARPVRSVVFGGTRGGYLVPRPDGTVLVGATEEHKAGFACRLTPGGLAEVAAIAEELAPALSEASVDRAWAGLRPGSRTGLPFLGPVPSRPGLSLATGHFRSGITLAPATGRLASAWLRGEASPLDLSAFAYEGS